MDCQVNVISAFHSVRGSGAVQVDGAGGGVTAMYQQLSHQARPLDRHAQGANIPFGIHHFGLLISLASAFIWLVVEQEWGAVVFDGGSVIRAGDDPCRLWSALSRVSFWIPRKGCRPFIWPPLAAIAKNTKGGGGEGG